MKVDLNWLHFPCHENYICTFLIYAYIYVCVCISVVKMSVYVSLLENVQWAVERDPGSCRGLPVPVLHEPTPSPPSSQRVSCCHEAPGSGDGEAVPGPLPLPGSELPEAVRAGPLLQPQESDGGDGGRWTFELGEGCFPFRLYRRAGQTAAGAEGHEAGAGPWTGTGTWACRPPGICRDHS